MKFEALVVPIAVRLNADHVQKLLDRADAAGTTVEELLQSFIAEFLDGRYNMLGDRDRQLINSVVGLVQEYERESKPTSQPEPFKRSGRYLTEENKAEVVRLHAGGMSQREIARQLKMSQSTVSRHVNDALAAAPTSP